MLLNNTSISLPPPHMTLLFPNSSTTNICTLCLVPNP
jgi:hypothetical protein